MMNAKELELKLSDALQREDVLKEKLAESQREFRAADATIENLHMQLNAERETKLALAAENAGMKSALRPSDIPSELTDAFGDTAVIEHDATGDNQGHSVSWSWVGNQEEVIKSVLLAVDKGIETPATDAFLAEVRAQGVEMFGQYHNFSEKLFIQKEAQKYAAQLRKGGATEEKQSFLSDEDCHAFVKAFTKGAAK